MVRQLVVAFPLSCFLRLVKQFQKLLHAPVKDRLVQSALPYCLHDLPIRFALGGGHFQRASGNQPGHAVVIAAPVGDHHALIAPFAVEDILQQVGAFVGVLTVDAVIGGHQAVDAALLDRHFKGRKIDLPQRALVHHGIHAHAAQLLGVGRIVLDAGGYAVRLDAADQGRGQLSGEVGVFGKILKVSAAEGAALDVHAGAQQDVDAHAGGLQPEMLAHLLDQRLVPGVGQSRGGRIAGGGNGIIQSQVISLSALLAHAVRPVAQRHGGDPKPRDRLGFPEVCPGTQRRLFLQRHLPDQFFKLIRHICRFQSQRSV